MDFYHKNLFHTMQNWDACFVLEDGLKTILPTVVITLAKTRKILHLYFSFKGLLSQGRLAGYLQRDIHFTTCMVWKFSLWVQNISLANIYLFKFNKRNTKKRCKISSKLKDARRHHIKLKSFKHQQENSPRLTQRNINKSKKSQLLTLLSIML